MCAPASMVALLRFVVDGDEWMSRASRNGYAAGKVTVQVDRYFAKYGAGARAAWIVWFLVACALLCNYMYAYLKLPIVVRGDYTTYRPGEDELLRNGLIIPLVAITVVLAILEVFLVRRAKRKRCERMDALTHAGSDVTPAEFLKSKLYEDEDFTGIYVLYNASKDKYYVGQSVHVLKRVRQHFTGHGNGDVYADWKYGDSFTIRVCKLVDSGYANLNDLERDAIQAYDAYDKGYNRTGGNAS